MLLLMAAPAAVAQNVAPAVSPPEGAEIVGESREAFATYPLITDRIVQRGGIQGNISATRTVEGALARRTYRLAEAADAESIAEGYATRLARAGFDTLYACEAEACGPMFERASPGARAAADLFSRRSGSYYRAVRRSAGGGDVYAAVQVTPIGNGVVAVQLDTLQVQAREIGAISVNAAEMADELDTKGRVALYGIFFNTDSAQIKSESQSTLGEIAKLMAEQPDRRLLVVGHTDSRGGFDYNIDLSKRRAEAVVEALTARYGVDPDRLKPWGVGYTAPRASNESDIGQAKNRRVELVAW
ncbi:OmpA family protein [Salinisphaera orenii]|nr:MULTISPECIES: OmpA family protein [Salinisphaera]